MTFYMDNSNDSETSAYSAALFAAAAQPSISADATGHSTLLAQYVLYPFAAVLQPVSGLYLIRGFVFARFVLGLALFGAAYAWYRHLGSGWLTSLLGLVLLSTSAAFGLQIRGWELDKVAEPVLYLVAGLAAWQRRYPAFLVIAGLAALNRETGAFMPLVALALRVPRWVLVSCLLLCLAIAVPLRLLGPDPSISPAAALAQNLQPDRLVYVIGGLCLMPLLAIAWLRTSPPPMQRLFWLLAPIWLAWVVATDRLEQGA